MFSLHYIDFFLCLLAAAYQPLEGVAYVHVNKKGNDTLESTPECMSDLSGNINDLATEIKRKVKLWSPLKQLWNR